MNDAGIEAKRDRAFGGMARVAHAGRLGAAVQGALADADTAHVIQRIWSKDASLWKSEAAHQKIIANSLGWLSVPGQMLSRTSELIDFAAGIRSEGFQQVMVCGMGGSSLCPEVLRQTFGPQENYPELYVLDSTDPDVIHELGKRIDLARCLFIIASKSGTTTEPIAFQRYWYSEVAKINQSPGQFFCAVTDPETQMVAQANAEKFKHIFLNQPDIGGRYSALSYFGMVPAALAGLEVKTLLQRAKEMSTSCKTTVALENPAALLGAIMAESAIAGRDKLTIITDAKLSALGLWIEQLVAESTGKEGKGIIPVIGESLGPVSSYRDDRLFVSISAGSVESDKASALSELEAAGHPVVYRTLTGVYDLSAEFFLWEMATAFAGWRLAINPFDQPNVQESKDATRLLLDQYGKERRLPEQSAIATDGALTVYAGANESLQATHSVKTVVRDHLNNIKAGDYIALLAYVEENPEIDGELQAIRLSLRDSTGCATTLGYGPRYLHSTGQLHKGGPPTGVFIQVTAKDAVDFDVPGTPYSFSILKQAQAQGDFQALLAHGRRVIRIDVGDDASTGLAKLRALIAETIKETFSTFKND